jgi:hypothetical protein
MPVFDFHKPQEQEQIYFLLDDFTAAQNQRGQFFLHKLAPKYGEKIVFLGLR